MKCEFCGGNLSLEAATCPYCGQPNKHAQQHAKKMRHYKKEFEQTRKNVYSVTQKYTEVTVKVIVLAVLMILTVLLFVVKDNIYSINRELKRSAAERNSEEYSRILDDYLEKGEYREFSLFCEEKYISSYIEAYEQYAPVINATNAYRRLCEDVMEVVTTEEPDEWLIESLAYNLDDFYRDIDMEEYEYYDNADRQENVKALEDMEHKIEKMLQIYCGLTEEETEGLKEMSEAKRTVLFEEKLIDE